ncbi:MAG: ankyrin repeat domain-containing protein [Legionella sp.]|jgi:hypothetical protein
MTSRHKTVRATRSVTRAQNNIANKHITYSRPNKSSAQSAHGIFATKSTKKRQPPYFSIEERKKIMQQVGIDNMQAKDYLPSTFDKKNLVMVKPVNVLKNFNCRGLYATQDILPGTCLGLYQGTYYAPENFDRYLEENTNANSDYAMEVEGKIVDAQIKGNFTRYINYSDTQSNVQFAGDLYYGQEVPKVITTRLILAGEQILVDYNHYNPLSSTEYSYLNPEDGWQSAQEVYEYNKDKYEFYELKYALDFIGLPKTTNLCVTPVIKTILEMELLDHLPGYPSSVDVKLPCLMPDSNTSIKDFSKLDTFSALMFACYLGQIKNTQWLIDKGSNIDQQQNRSGKNPLIFALLGYSLTNNSKDAHVKIIHALIKAGAHLEAHNRHDQTFLHLAVTVLSDEDFESTIKLIHECRRTQFKSLYAYIDNQNNDIVQSCIKAKLWYKLKQLLNYNPDYIQTYYSGDEEIIEFNKQSFKNVLKYLNANEEVRLQRILVDLFFDPNFLLYNDLISKTKQTFDDFYNSMKL